MLLTPDQSVLSARICAVLAALLLSQPLAAHDFWIEPTVFSARPGESVGVKLRVGERLVGDPLPLMPLRINQFIADEGGERRSVEGRFGADPAGVVRVNKAGLLIVGYFSRPSLVELPADKFNTYLAEEGLDAVAALRAQRRQTDAPSRELFSRCAKSLLRAGEGSGKRSGGNTDMQGDHPLGFPLELVAERNPYAPYASVTSAAAGGGQEFSFRLIFQNRPLAGAQVAALNTRNPTERQVARTDGEGRVRLHLQPGGMWLIKAVHMIEAPAGSGADWTSYWASLTFEMQAAGSGGKQLVSR